MKTSTIILLALSALGIYLTWLSIKATEQNTTAIMQSTNSVIGPTSQITAGRQSTAQLSQITNNPMVVSSPNLPAAASSPGSGVQVMTAPHVIATAPTTPTLSLADSSIDKDSYLSIIPGIMGNNPNIIGVPKI